MTPRPSVIKPDSRENKTTIQVTKDIKDILSNLGLKGESYNQIIATLISQCQKQVTPNSAALAAEIRPNCGQIKLGENITVSKYERILISIKDKINLKQPNFSSPAIILEAVYNKPFTKEDDLYQIDLKINNIIFDNEIYSPKEFFGVLQKDMAYCSEFVYYYLRAILEVIKIEFKKSNFFFLIYKDFFDLARWRTYLLNSKLSPEILSSDIEAVFSDLKNEKTNKKLIEDVKNSYYSKILDFGGYHPK